MCIRDRIFTDGQVTALDTTGPDPGSTFGAAVMDRHGVLYAVAGGDGTIYRYLIEQDRAQAARFSATVQNAYQDGTCLLYTSDKITDGWGVFFEEQERYFREAARNLTYDRYNWKVKLPIH